MKDSEAEEKPGAVWKACQDDVGMKQQKVVEFQTVSLIQSPKDVLHFNIFKSIFPVPSLKNTAASAILVLLLMILLSEW